MLQTHPTSLETSGTHRTTITAVARAAGVSIGTVSKVVNGRTGVGPATRARVEDAIGSLGYVSIGERQGAAFATREATIETLLDPRDITNPYFSTFLGGAMEAAGRLNAALVLRNIDSVDDQSPTTWAQTLGRSGRIGVIEVTSTYSARRQKALVAAGLPMVLVDPIDVPRTSTQSIGATNWAGAFSATQHLLELGHTRISYIGGPIGAYCDVVRSHGWAAAMSEAGLTVDAQTVPRAGYTFEHGFRATLELLASPVPPTAIFAGSDTTAMGALEAARVAGVRVPDELSVIGFDDTVLAQASTPPLTTVHQPIADIGRLAVQTLLRLARGEVFATKRVELSTHLVVRESTAPPPADAPNGARP